MQTKKVLVVSAGYKKSYPIIKELSRAKYNVVVATYSFRAPSFFSRYVKNRYYISNPHRNHETYFDDVLKIIRKEKPSIVIPVGFMDVFILSKYKKVEEEM